MLKFLCDWRGRQPGQLDGGLPHGVAVELVRRGIAVVVEDRNTEEPADKRAPPRRRHGR